MQEMDAALILTKQDVLIFFIKGDKRYIIKIWWSSKITLINIFYDEEVNKGSETAENGR